ncbi:MAG: right-handed parallel beta-helix repeat-containing protein [Actinomycetota bacterium]
MIETKVQYLDKYVETKVQYWAVCIGAGALMAALVTALLVAFSTGEPAALPQQAATPDFDVETDSGIGSSSPLVTTPEFGASSQAIVAAPQPTANEQIDPLNLPSYQRPLNAGCAEPVQISPPASDLPSVAATAAPGTCFLLSPGEYRFHNVVPRDGQSFIGTSRDEVVVLGTDQTENAFHGTADGVNIGRMTLTGFQGSGGQKRQEQGAIRGTSRIWQSDEGEMATDWLVEDVTLSNNYANGIFLGDHFTVRSSLIENNGVAGLGGDEIIGGLVIGNVVRGNGSQQDTGYLANGGGMKFTQTVTAEQPLVIRGNEVYDNPTNGVWCDIACQGFIVEDNYFHDQSSRAVMIELSSNAIIRNNIMINTNTWTDFGRDFNAGAITVGESSNVLVEGNYIDGAKAGVIVRQTQRPRRPQESFLDNYSDVTYVSGQVEVRNNILLNTGSMGVSLGTSGRGMITDPDSIRFDDNTYADPGSMSFFWANGDRYNVDSWRSSGRDTGGLSQVPPQPAWSLATRPVSPLAFPGFEPGY